MLLKLNREEEREREREREYLVAKNTNTMLSYNTRLCIGGLPKKQLLINAGRP